MCVNQLVVGDLVELAVDESSNFLREMFNGTDVVVHAAARVHVMYDDAFDPLTEFRKVNRDATLVLARLASKLGVKRFVFLSSIKVNGEMTWPGHPFILDDMSVIGPRPLTAQTFSSYSDTTQAVIKQVKPGLSGVGAIIFRSEEEIMHGATASVDFYANVIAPYKAALEEWFVSNKSLYMYFVAIFVTAWAVLIPSTKIAWRVFKDLPEPPAELKQALNFTD